MFKDILKRKRGGLALGSTPADLLALAIFAVVLLFFFVLFFYQGCSNANANLATAMESGGYLDSDFVLLNYLRTPIYIEGAGMVMADSVNLIHNPLYREYIRNESRKIRETNSISLFYWCRGECTEFPSEARLGIDARAASAWLPTIDYSINEVEMYKPIEK